MKKQKCERCKKVIEGYTENHVETLMAQHMIKHQNEDRRKKEKVEEELNNNKLRMNKKIK